MVKFFDHNIWILWSRPDRRTLVLRFDCLLLPIRMNNLSPPCFCYKDVNGVMLDGIYDETEVSGLFRGV